MNISSCFLIICTAASLFLSAYAIRCHQCNSHTDPDCWDLRLNIPRPRLDDQYLRDCDVKADAPDAVLFCRKIVTSYNVNDEKRVVRSCGHIVEETRKHNMSCFDADNEGFKQRICACYQDGCNAAPSLTTNSQLIIFAVISICTSLLFTHFS